MMSGLAILPLLMILGIFTALVVGVVFLVKWYRLPKKRDGHAEPPKTH